MIRVVIIGAGNVAIQLAKALKANDSVELVQYYSRSATNESYFPSSIARTDNLMSLSEADIYIVAVKDDAISDLSLKLKKLNGLVVHTSGTIPLEAIADCPRRGVFYPVQTFSKDREIDWSNTPLTLETGNPDDMLLLRSLASVLSESIFEIDSQGRKKLHLAAVFANNFSNHMFTLSKEVCFENQLPFELIKPLILETAKKVMSLEPEEAQTGPARRHDKVVMKEQMAQLDQKKKEIYSLLSESIADRYGKIRNK